MLRPLSIAVTTGEYPMKAGLSNYQRREGDTPMPPAPTRRGAWLVHPGCIRNAQEEAFRADEPQYRLTPGLLPRTNQYPDSLSL